jgi:hypothetical protein
MYLTLNVAEVEGVFRTSPAPVVGPCHGLQNAYQGRKWRRWVSRCVRRLIKVCRLRRGRWTIRNSRQWADMWAAELRGGQLPADVGFVVGKVELGQVRVWVVRHVSKICEKRLLASPCPSVCPSAWNNSATTGRIFMKFAIWIFF